MNDFYIYIYLDSRKPGQYCYENICFLFKPFYVGKGKDNRWKDIIHRNKYFKNKINKIKKLGLKLIIFKLYDNLNEKESFEKEIKLISEIEIINPGILVNMTNGGDGRSGYIMSEKSKKLISEKNKKYFLDIKNKFEKRNYILLSDEEDYKNSYTKLKCICPNGHEGSISWSNFQQGRGCSYCAKKKINFSDIKKEFEKRKYTLLSEEKDYKNAHQKLKYICPNGHKGFIDWSHFHRGQGCPIEGRLKNE